MKRAKENFARPYGLRDFEFVRAGPDGAYWQRSDGMVVRMQMVKSDCSAIRKPNGWTLPGTWIGSRSQLVRSTCGFMTRYYRNLRGRVEEEGEGEELHTPADQRKQQQRSRFSVPCVLLRFETDRFVVVIRPSG